jgi:hypothetical protein
VAPGLDMTVLSSQGEEVYRGNFKPWV